MEKLDGAGSKRRWWQEEGKLDTEKLQKKPKAASIKLKNQTIKKAHSELMHSGRTPTEGKKKHEHHTDFEKVNAFKPIFLAFVK